MRSTWLRTVTAALAVLAVAGVTAMPAAAEQPPGEPGSFIEGTDSSCFFNYGAFGQTSNARGELAYNIAYPDGDQVNYGYDAAGNVSTVSNYNSASNYAVFTGYNAFGQVGGIAFPNGASMKLRGQGLK